MKSHILYRTTCVVTGRFYVGMHTTTNVYDGYIGSGLRLKRSVAKYGLYNHHYEIICFCASRQELAALEKKIVTKKLLSNLLCMNLKLGGEGGWDHIDFTDPRRLAGSSKGSTASLTKLWANPKYRESISINSSVYMIKAHAMGLRNPTFTGKSHTDETKKKIGEANAVNSLGEHNGRYGSCWIYNPVTLENKVISNKDAIFHVRAGWKIGRKLIEMRSARSSDNLTLDL